MYKRVLVLAPHTDDGEFGCGGSIARFIDEGSRVYYIAFSIARESVPEGLPEDILATEVREATNRLGIRSEDLYIEDFPVRRLNEHRQDILERLIQLRREIDPDLVLLPAPGDVHQDHQTVAMEGIRAFKKTSILGYELPWNSLSFKNQAFVGLSEENLKKKIHALEAYESQYFRYYASEKLIKGLAFSRGVMVDKEYAEVFEVIRYML